MATPSDDELFLLWKNGTCEKEDVFLLAARPQELAARIRLSEQQSELESLKRRELNGDT